MGSLPTFHDDYFARYEVDCEKRTITLFVRSAHWRDPQSLSRITFVGVVGYHFKDDAFSNVIMHIEDVAPDQFVDDFGAELAESFRVSGAVAEWARSSEDAKRAMRELRLHAVVINSTMGLEGWVIAQDFSVSVEN
jgi:hypothetical protein